MNDVVFMEEDYVFIKVSPMKGVMRFGKKRKLAPRYIGPFKLLKRIGEVVYQLALPPNLSQVHPVFHISMLRKYVHDPSHVLHPEAIKISEDLSHEEQPVAIVDHQVRKLQSKSIPMVKVLWSYHSVEE
ncbi:hypothetical protein M5689_006522 [Euphorbia peplus]|nr:hypothetical protein M5689_006522 [Euphorbia peplus]